MSISSEVDPRGSNGHWIQVRRYSDPEDGCNVAFRQPFASEAIHDEFALQWNKTNPAPTMSLTHKPVVSQCKREADL